MERLWGNSVKAGWLSRIAVLGLILILLLVGSVASQAFTPKTAAASTAALCPSDYRIVSSYWEQDVFVSQLEVRFNNHGPGDAFNVKATIATTPANAVATDTEVTLGDIPVDGNAWSSDYYELQVNMSNPQDPQEGLTWTVEYDDADGNHHVIENVPQFCEEQPEEPPPIPTDPEPPLPEPVELAVTIKYMTIQWSRDCGRWGWPKKDTFSIWGRLQLPEGYTLADLKKEAIVSIDIGDSSGNDVVTLRERVLRRLGVRWTYRGSEQPPGKGMNIRQATIWWAPDGSRWAGKAGFYIKGVLELPSEIGSGTDPEAVVTLEIPTDGVSLLAEKALEFRVFPRLNRWSYKANPRLPRFRFDP
jgi:hypothetical protein